MQQNNPQEQLTKKERKALRRQERQELQTKRQRNQTTKKIAVWIIAALFIGGSAYGIYYLANQPEKSRPGEEVTILGEEHIAVGASHPPYNSNPPTSGWHYAEPADWGMHEQELPDEQVLHNLEHGGIWISYKDIDNETKDKLEAIAKKFTGSVIITSRSANDAPIALASWGRLEKMDSFDEARILEFINANINKSPEPLAR